MRTCTLISFTTAFLLCGCLAIQVSSLNQVEPYNAMVGKRYLLTNGAFILKTVAFTERTILVPAGNSSYRTPSSLNAEHIGKIVGDGTEYRIEDLVPAHSILKIQKIQREHSIGANDIFYYTEIDLPNGKKYNNVSMVLLMDGNEFPPILRDRRIQEVQQK
jgi:hypothetical protein